MPFSFRVIDSGKLPPQEIMELDQRLLENLENSEMLIIHFYEWSKRSATYGLFIRPEDYLNLEGVSKQNLHLAKRPTGGGIVFHLSDFAFSVLVSAKHPAFSINTLDNYAFVNRAVIQAIQTLKVDARLPELLASQPKPLDVFCEHFCMAHPTKYDVMMEGRKVGGAAQRRTKCGFLHQGTISLAMPSPEFLQDVLKSPTVMQGMQQQAHALLGNASESQLNHYKQALRASLQHFLLEKQN